MFWELDLDNQGRQGSWTELLELKIVISKFENLK